MLRGASAVAFFTLVALACGGKVDPGASALVVDPAGASSSGSTSRHPGSSGSSGSSGQYHPPGSDISLGDGGISRPSCGTVLPFSTGFEEGVIDARFQVAGLAAFALDTANPIDGSASLRVTPAQGSYIFHSIGSACAVKISFVLRPSPDLIQNGGTIARIAAGPDQDVTVRIDLGGLVFDASGDNGGSFENPFGSAPAANIPIRVEIALDLGAQTFTATAGAAPSTVVGGIDLPLNDQSNIQSVELGDPGESFQTSGRYWLDDISIQ